MDNEASVKTPSHFVFQVYFNLLCGGGGGASWLPGRLEDLKLEKNGWTGAVTELRVGEGDSDGLSCLWELQDVQTFRLISTQMEGRKAS